MIDKVMILHKRCPFCGSVGEIDTDGSYSQHPERFMRWAVRCSNRHCLAPARTAYLPSKWEAIQAWDTRFDPLARFGMEADK